MSTVNVLNVSKPVDSCPHPVTGDLVNFNSAEDLIVFCARVSNPKNQSNFETSQKLIKYLIKHGHWSPFEMASVGMQITTSRAIGRELLRHRSFSFQEFSQRYAMVSKTEPIELRENHPTNRQSSAAVIEDPDLNNEVASVISNSLKVYSKLITAGVARETARFVLPEAASTTLYMHGTVRSWLHFTHVREGMQDEQTVVQKECQIIAKQCANELEKHFPVVFAAVKDFYNV